MKSPDRWNAMTMLSLSFEVEVAHRLATRGDKSARGHQTAGIAIAKTFSFI